MFRLLSVAFALTLGAHAHAGVLGPSDSAASEAARTSNDVLKATTGANTNQASKAVDMLIELQPQKAGVDFNQRSTAPAAGSSTRLVPAGSNLPTPAADAATRNPAVPVNNAGLFGTQATPPVVRDVPPATSSRFGDSGEGPRHTAGGVQRVNNADSSHLPWWTMPREWLSRLRENRDWLIVLLLLVGGSLLAVRLVSRRWR